MLISTTITLLVSTISLKTPLGAWNNYKTNRNCNEKKKKGLKVVSVDESNLTTIDSRDKLLEEKSSLMQIKTNQIQGIHMQA